MKTTISNLIACFFLTTLCNAEVADFNDLSAGDVVTDYNGIVIDTDQRSSALDVGMIFDSSCFGGCSGGDTDLRTPGYHPTNVESLGNVLMISEDGDASDPDDSALGGHITFHFPYTALVSSITVIDVEESGGYISDVYGVVAPIQALGDNSVQVIPLRNVGVPYIKVVLAGSGAVDNIDYTEYIVSSTTTTTSTSTTITTSTTSTTVPLFCEELPILDDPARLLWSRNPKPGVLHDRFNIHGRIEPTININPEGMFKVKLSNPAASPFLEWEVLIVANRNGKSWKSVTKNPKVQVKRRLIRSTGVVSYSFKIVEKLVIGPVTDHFIYTTVEFGCVKAVYNSYWSGQIGRQLRAFSF